MTTHAVSVEVLLQHAGWLRALARQLVRDDSEADDAVQDTWTHALRSPPQHAANVQGWLGRVLRNVVRSRRREAAARQGRERAASRPESTADDSALVAQADEFRTLVDCVHALPEPYRSTVLLHYFRGEPLRAIAARHGVPPSTVRSRLQRAHARLRRDLDARHGGDRRAWTLAFAPWLAETRSPVLAVPALAAGAVLIAGGAITVWQLAGGSAETTHLSSILDGESTGTVDADGSASPLGIATPLPPAERVAVGEPLATPPAGVTDAHALAGRVLDLGQVPIADQELRFVSEQNGSTSAFRCDGRGHFAFTASVPGYVEVASPELCTVLAGYARADGTDPELVVVATSPATAVGQVVDEFGLPVAEASVHARLPDGFRQRFGIPLDGSYSEEWTSASRPDGTFDLALPEIPSLPIAITRDGYLPRSITFEELRLLRGHIVLRAQLPRGESALEDEPNQGPPTETFAVQGTVVDAQGRGLSDVRLWVQAMQEGDRASAAASKGGLSDAEGRFAISGLLPGKHRLIGVHKGTLGQVRSRVLHRGDRPRLVLDADAFQPLAGRVVDAAGMPAAGVTVEAVRALPTLLQASRRVTLFSGTRASRTLAAGPVNVSYVATGPSTVTDANGAFSFTALDRAGTQLRIFGPRIVQTHVPLGRAGPIDVTVRKRTHLQVVVQDPTVVADSAALLGPDGSTLPTKVDEGPFRRLYERRFTLTDGLSEVLTVPASAVTLVLFLGDREVARRAVRLQPGELHKITF